MWAEFYFFFIFLAVRVLNLVSLAVLRLLVLSIGGVAVCACVTYVNRESVLSTTATKFCQHTPHISLRRVFALETWVCWLPQEVLVRFSLLLPLLALVLLLSSIFFFALLCFYSFLWLFAFLSFSICFSRKFSQQQLTGSSSSNRNRILKWVRNFKFYLEKNIWINFYFKCVCEKCEVFEQVFSVIYKKNNVCKIMCRLCWLEVYFIDIGVKNLKIWYV